MAALHLNLPIASRSWNNNKLSYLKGSTFGLSVLRADEPQGDTRKTLARRQFRGIRSQLLEQVQSEVNQNLFNKKQGTDSTPSEKKLKILVAGAGIGGLVFALAAKNRGLDVTVSSTLPLKQETNTIKLGNVFQVFERDLTAIRGEGQYRGPIQIQSNALGALEAVDQDVANEIMEKGTVTGDRINGLVDGVSGEWFVPISSSETE